MKPVQIQIIHAAIPFRFRFSHSLKARDVGDSVLVVVTDADGHKGYGECAPRPYVTGETSDSVIQTIDQHLAPLFLRRRYESFEDLRTALESAAVDLPRDSHAAFCALELALLDLGGKVFETSAGAVLGRVLHSEIEYSGILSASSDEATRATCQKLAELGVRTVKAKVGGALDDDLRVLRTVREILGDEASLRVDANCAWDGETALERLGSFAPFRLDAIEQPCPPEAIDDLALVTRNTEIPVIVDESLVSLDDARRLADAGACDLFNVRISKCGGLILSGKVRDLAESAGLGCMLGAQVGETAVLAAAGRQFAARSNALRFHEGSYGALLLQEDASDDLKLGPRGRGIALEGPGLGLDVDLARIAPFLEVRRLAESTP